VTDYFVSDLHIDASQPGIARQFIEFLAGEVRGAGALYVLGDLFEVWLGDDDPAPDKRAVIAALRRLADSGTRCYLMHGNRDFLIGPRLCAEAGCTLLADGSVVEVQGRRVLLMHGDSLCTDDLSYQRLRRVLRNPLMLALLPRLPLTTRQRLAARLRAGSRRHTGSTAPEIMDVNPQAVAAAFARFGVATLIHGHTHRPAVHRLALPAGPVRRIVLGDWYAQGSVLVANDGEFALRALPR
jgi:UDP-2,3-diacylglucosamine hydrolase